MRRAVVGILLLASVGLLGGPGSAAPTNPCVGTMAEPAGGVTVISTQGARLAERGAHKRPARIVGVGPAGAVRWVYHASRDQGIVWAYDVDPTPDGNVFVTATKLKRTVFFVLDPATGEVVWREEVDLFDTHDADLLDEHRILIANMRNYDPETGVNNERLTIYNRTTDEFVWEWRFDEHFPRDGGLNYTGDWTHVNDVDRIAPGKYLASVRNFDQVIVVDRATDEIVRSLGQQDREEIMDEQHNPQYLESESGRPTLLIADSRNGRVVEYEHGLLGWQRTWRLGSSDTLTWPRDADRLPDGNTLVTDSTNNRVIEVTPGGTVVWEFYAPWLVYDAERMHLGDEPGGPTIADQRAGGAYELRDAEPWDPQREVDCASFLLEWSGGTPTPDASPTARPTTVPPTTAPPTDTPTATTSTPGQPGFGAAPSIISLLAAIAIARYRS